MVVVDVYPLSGMPIALIGGDCVGRIVVTRLLKLLGYCGSFLSHSSSVTSTWTNYICIFSANPTHFIVSWAFVAATCPTCDSVIILTLILLLLSRYCYHQGSSLAFISAKSCFLATLGSAKVIKSQC